MKSATLHQLRSSSLCGSLVFAVALTLSGSAQADSAGADALFEQGKRLMAEESYAEACKKFEASYNLDKTLGTLLNLANCNETLGLVATSWAQWGEAVERANKLGDARADYAQERRDELRDRLPHLTIVVVNPVPALEVRRGDSVLAEGTFGVSLPVDPGQQVIQVLRGEQVLKQDVVTLAEKERAEVRLDLAAIDKAVPPEAPPPAPPSVVTVAPAITPPPSGDTQRTVGFVIGGVGVASLVAAGVFGVVALTKKGSADEPDACVGEEEKFCTPAGLDDVSSAKTFANLTQWVGIGGMVVTIVGATLVLTAPSGSELDQRAEAPEPPKPRAWASPWFGPEGAGVGLDGTF